MTCPWCLEDGASGNQCDRCGRPLIDEAGQRLRAIDIRLAAVLEVHTRRLVSFLIAGSVVVIAVSILAPFIAVLLTPLAVATLCPVLHLITLRVRLVAPLRPLLGRGRRLLTRWASRVAVLSLGAIGYGSMAVPGWGTIAGLITFVGLTLGVDLHHRWSLDREARRLPFSLWEKVVVIGFLVLAVSILVATASAALFLGWVAAEVQGLGGLT